MRTRIGNPSNEAHGQPMRVHDWIAPVGTIPDTVLTQAQSSLGVKLEGSTGEMHGYINTSKRPDGSLYIAIHLYDVECIDSNCRGGHGPIKLLVAPPVPPGLLVAMKATVGEHPQHKLTNSNAEAVLIGLGFTPNDGPRR